MARNFGMFLNFIDLICISKFVIVFSIYFLQSTSKIWMHQRLLFPSKMYSITTKYQHVLKLHTSALYTKISQRIVYRFSSSCVSEGLWGLFACMNENLFKKGSRFCIFLNNYLFIKTKGKVLEIWDSTMKISTRTKKIMIHFY